MYPGISFSKKRMYEYVKVMLLRAVRSGSVQCVGEVVLITPVDLKQGWGVTLSQTLITMLD